MTISRKLEFHEALKPICALCRKEVERMDMMHEKGHRGAHNIALVYCHGKRRECRIDDKHFYQQHLHRGIAFLDELDPRLIEGTIQEIQQKFVGQQKGVSDGQRDDPR